MKTLMTIIYNWAKASGPTKITDVMRELGIAEHTAVDWYNFMRDICQEWYTYFTCSVTMNIQLRIAGVIRMLLFVNLEDQIPLLKWMNLYFLKPSTTGDGDVTVHGCWA